MVVGSFIDAGPAPEEGICAGCGERPPAADLGGLCAPCDGGPCKCDDCTLLRLAAGGTE